MRRMYPYLDDSYFENWNDAKERRNFLQSIEEFVNQKQYIRITLLNWDEEPIKEIEGEISSGSITKDGSSAIRRTASITASVSGNEYDIENLNMDFAINKKVFIEVGIKNYSDQYKEYPILYFPQGVFFISSFSASSSATSVVQMNIGLKDKMMGLSGDVGGKFPNTITLDEVDTQNINGEYVAEKVLIYDLIEELVHHWGGEDLNNIVIEDVPKRIKQVLQWGGDNPCWLIPREGADAASRWYDIYIDRPVGDLPPGTLQIPNGSDIGYEYTDFIYSSELVASAGDSVCNILDKIKEYLGNFEYFYDVFGIFHFREIKNYLNTTQATAVLDEMDTYDYLIDMVDGKSIYTFSNDTNLVSISLNPSYENIKNDYVILGTRKMEGTDTSRMVMYHLAIDSKPIPGNRYYDLLVYEEPGTNLTKLAFPLSITSFAALPMPGNFNIIYRCIDENTFWYWDDNVYKEITPLKYYKKEEEAAEAYVTKDWRTEMYLQGMLNKNRGTDAGSMFRDISKSHELSMNDKSWLGDVYRRMSRQRVDTDYYFEELDAFWPEIYDLEAQRFYGETPSEVAKKNLTNSIEDKKKKIAKAKDDIEKNTLSLQEFNLARDKDILETRMKINTDSNKLSRLRLEYGDFPNGKKRKLEESLNKANEDQKKAFDEWEKAKGTKDEETKKKAWENATGTWYYYKEQLEELENTTGKEIKHLENMLNKDIPTSHYASIEDYENQKDYKKKQVEGLNEDLKANIARWKEEIKDVQVDIEELEDESLLASTLCDGNYYLDFIDPASSQLGQFSIRNIGRRTQVTTNEEINCLFEPEIPNIVLINKDMDDQEEFEKLKSECLMLGQPFTQVSGDIYNACRTGGYKNSAFVQLQYELYLHTNYQKSISVTSIPAWYLEPNTRITVNDKSTNTYGDFLMNNITLPLGAGNLMSASANECVNKM